VETGNGGLRFRPVVFVDVLTGGEAGKLVLLQGEIEEVGTTSFLLCDTHSVSRERDGARAMLSRDDDDDDEGEDEGDREDSCVDVRVHGDTSFFDENGDPAMFHDVEAGDHASVLGHFEHAGEDLEFDAEVVQLGEDVLAVDGLVASEVGPDDRFDLDLDAGQGVVTDDGLLAIQLQPGTRIFARDGHALDSEDVQPGDTARALGVLALSSSDDDILKAAAVVVDVENESEANLEGEITSVESGGARLEIDTEDDGTACVDVPSDAELFRITSDGGTSHVDAIDRSQLMHGDRVSVFGTPGASCLEASTLIVLEE
jgi:hypothetical protein